MNQLTSWSFSSLMDYETCPRRAFYRLIERAPMPPEDPDSPLVRGNRLHKHIEDYITGAKPLDPEITYDHGLLDELHEAYKLNFVNVEEEWAYDRDWNLVTWRDATCRMKLDVGVVSPSAYKVIDWKSGKKAGNEIKHTMQGQLYAVGALARYPELLRIDVEFHYIDHTDVKPLVATYTPDKVARFRATYDKRAARMLADTEFKAVPNKSNCRYCPFAITGHCPVAVK